MKERPILFSGEMVRAILAGRKTQTRRVIKPQPRLLDNGRWYWQPSRTSYAVVLCEDLPGDYCPYGQLGDRLWVRETFAYIWPDLDPVPLKECNIEYKADAPNAKYPGDWIADEAQGNEDAPKWRPSIFMPRWASRLTLEIVNVKAERVQDITRQDALAEGVDIDPEKLDPFTVWPSHMRPESAFRLLWDSINAERGYGWDSNPWTWAIEFKKVMP